MSLKIGGGGGEKKERELIPAGVHNAVCYLIADIGTQETEWQGEKKMKRQVVIGWEVPEFRIEINGKDLPRATSRLYTASLHEKANLRKDISGWRGKALSEEESSGFDLKVLLGQPAMIQFVHNESNGKSYSNINAIMPCKEKIEAENELQWFSLDEDGDIPENIPQWIVDKIEDSDERRSAHGREHDSSLDFPDDPSVPVTDDDKPEEEDDLPF